MSDSSIHFNTELQPNTHTHILTKDALDATIGTLTYQGQTIATVVERRNSNELILAVHLASKEKLAIKQLNALIQWLDQHRKSFVETHGMIQARIMGDFNINMQSKKGLDAIQGMTQKVMMPATLSCNGLTSKMRTVGTQPQKIGVPITKSALGELRLLLEEVSDTFMFSETPRSHPDFPEHFKPLTDSALAAYALDHSPYWDEATMTGVFNLPSVKPDSATPALSIEHTRLYDAYLKEFAVISNVVLQEQGIDIGAATETSVGATYERIEAVMEDIEVGLRTSVYHKIIASLKSLVSRQNLLSKMGHNPDESYEQMQKSNHQFCTMLSDSTSSMGSARQSFCKWWCYMHGPSESPNDTDAIKKAFGDNKKLVPDSTGGFVYAHSIPKVEDVIEARRRLVPESMTMAVVVESESQHIVAIVPDSISVLGSHEIKETALARALALASEKREAPADATLGGAAALARRFFSGQPKKEDDFQAAQASTCIGR